MRLSVSDENYNDARVALIKENNWTNVAIIHQDSIEYSLVRFSLCTLLVMERKIQLNFFRIQMVAQLAKRLNESNINIILTQSASWVNLTSALQTLRVGVCHLSKIFDRMQCDIDLGEKSSDCIR